MDTWTAGLLCKADLQLGEGAHWHPEWKKFLYVDIERGRVGCIDAVTGIMEEKEVYKRVGTVVPYKNDTLIVALQGSIEAFDFATGELKRLTGIETDRSANRCNEGKCDAAGRLWVGTMQVNAAPGAGALYCYNGSLQKKLEGISVSNGICWSNDDRTMYYIDSFEYHIRAYDYDGVTGMITNERIVVEIKEPGCMPDGMAIDEGGMLWVAMWGGACIQRYDPGNGNLIGRVIVGVPNVTSCAFGGENLDELFITTARSDLSSAQLQAYPLSGSLFIAKVNIKGNPPNFFKL